MHKEDKKVMNQDSKAWMWDKLLEYGVQEQTLQVVTSINGYTEKTLLDILYAYLGYRSFEQVEEEFQVG